MEQINLNKRNAVYLLINGAGSNNKDVSKYEIINNNIVEVINYNSSIFNCINDINQCNKDATKINEGEKLDENKRFSRMYNLIKFYLLYTNLEIIIIGFSHGSLIIHGAINKLKMNLNENLQTELNSNRIYIITNGSPRYLPKELLEKKQIYNIYNIEDQILNNFIARRNKNYKFPNFKFNINDFKEICNFDKKTINYLDNEEYIYVNLINFQKGLFLNHTSGNNIRILFNCYFFPIVLKDFFFIIKIKNQNIKVFDRKLFLIGNILLNNFNKENIISEIDIDKENLKLLDDKDLFQLYFICFPEKEIYKIKHSFLKFYKKRNNNDNSKTIKVNSIKDKLYLLSYNQLSIIKYDGHHKEFSNSFEFIENYNLFINKTEISNIKILKYLSIFDRNTFIKELKTININKEILFKLDDDILVSIFIKINKIIYENLKNL